MKDLGHGANVNNMAKQFGKNEENIIDFSSNVNPHIISNLGKYVLEGLEKSRSYPDINYTNLRENMVVTDEPGIYIPGKFGVRIEDTVQITKFGCVSLTNSEKGYVII